MISIPLHSTTNSYHLGNNREVVDACGAVTQVTNYYPFGAPYADATASKGSDVQPYKYNGKELDLMHGLNTYDYGARQHDPILARWDRIDPLCEKYYSTSPYAYCLNNPVRYIDPDGRDNYRFDSQSGTFYLMEKNEDKTDRVLNYKYDKKTDSYQKKKGIKIDKVEKGILKDGANYKDKNQIISIGGKDGPSVRGVKAFVLDFSELIGKEISGLGYSADGSGNITDIEIGSYKNNKYDVSSCSGNALHHKYLDCFEQEWVYMDFHTHPDGKLGATQQCPELSGDVHRMRRLKSARPNASYVVLYRQYSEMQEYDYTEK